MHATRPAAVSGTFYPDQPEELAHTVEQLLDQGKAALVGATSTPPVALITPHAGYMYSGQIAARAFAALKPWKDHFKRVVLIGPAHRASLNGVGLSSAGYFRTPLGEVTLDMHEIARLEKLQGFEFRDDAHQREHSLEVQLPFLQKVLGDFHLIPLLVGHTSPELVAQALERYWGSPETLIVLSTDLSHYHPDAEARQLDAATADAIAHLEPDVIGEQHACGRFPLRALLDVARRHRAHVQTLATGNSSDVGGDPERVVGYGSWLLTG